MTTFRWTDSDVRRALGLGEGTDQIRFDRISTDTRAIAPGDLFVALRGERFDAHEFLTGAAEAGASGVVVSTPPADLPEQLHVYEVADTLVALGALAAYRRDRLEARVVGVAGSNGKTTTKELVRAALSPRFRSHGTEGNLNNRVGVPLTLLAVPEDAEAVVVEMGTNIPGEIEMLTRIVRPDAAIITSIGEEHLEGLGSVEGVLEEELALFQGLAPDGVALVSDEPVELAQRTRSMVPGEVRVAGFFPGSDLRPDGGEERIEVRPDGTTRWSWEGHSIHLPLPGRFNVRNALLALGLAREWGVEPAEAARAISEVKIPKLRGQWVTIGELRVLADCYNSNPPSARAAVELLASIPSAGRKVAVLGTMREMGAATEQVHREVAERVVEQVGRGVDLVVATGAFVPAFETFRDQLGDRIVAEADPIEAFHRISPALKGDETVLLKASRGEALERWIPLLEQQLTP